MENLQKKLKNFLFASEKAAASRGNVDFCGVSLMLLRLLVNVGKPVLAALPELNSVDRVVAELQQLMCVTGSAFRILPIPECGRGKLIFPEQESKRARALDALLRGEYDLAIGSVHALLAPAPPPDEAVRSAITLKKGMSISMEELIEKLVALDYDDEFEASVTGEFARRGGIVDIFSPAADHPCRVEFFGDEIESLRKFSPQTRRSVEELEEYNIIARSGITAGGAASGDAFDYVSPGKVQLFALYPEQSAELIGKYSGPEMAEHWQEHLKRFQESSSFTACYDAAATPLHPEALPADAAAPLFERNGAVSGEARETALKLNREMLFNRLENSGDEIFFLAPDKEDIPLLEAWKEKEFPGFSIHCEVSPLNFGFSLPQENVSVLTLRELVCAGFTRPGHWEENETPPPASGSEPLPAVPEFSLADLDEGDCCVHLDHGIGIYRGIKNILERNGVIREALAIEYRDGQILYVPLLQAHKVSRYLGAPGKVKLHKLGASRWSKDKENARSGVRTYAADMLKLQAVREHISGFAYPPDCSETRAFMRAFPFTDTPDQLRSTEEIRKDLESARPMDRLLCGDVGYGKTEIAMRAVFKAVINGKQAAILAPTTVLAQQHFLSFRERFAEFPFNIEVLSRFKTPVEQRDILRRLSEGKVDIIIGTHRLCGNEVRFKDLGLVVVDEEQRFGVQHKERLRRFRAEVDVLTMSATPIPRTLYLAMAGARDLSTLMTAPKLRLPVKTVIAPEEPEMIANAIRAELARGGQVYYLHNRVRTIEEKASKLRQLIPEARFAVAHGQMAEGRLEEIMQDFLDRKVDCLVASTIIESGLDVPNANTIIIERADRFGLAELYQLRGRVGRWTRQAFAYLLMPKHQLISTDARKRLSAIRRCSNLGAGFQLALHDLEIRGAGNILGAEQSGHLNTIGFDLYCHLLKQEVAKLRGEKVEYLPEVDMAIDFISYSIGAPAGMLDAAIPAEYIGGERLRLDAYRRLCALSDTDELDEFALELTDRFGPLPKCVKNLLDVVRLRIFAARANYSQLSVADGKLLLKNPGSAVYRENGLVPTIDYRDPPELRMVHLRNILSRAAQKQ